MGTGIIICGLNGAGKSTLGKALANKLNFYFIDIEALCFSETDGDYAFSRPRGEIQQRLLSEAAAHDSFVFTCVKGDYGEAVYPLFKYAVLVEAPKNIRARRVRDRSFQKFGDRMLPGGDLYEREERFFSLVETRAENAAEIWAQSLRCPVIRVDGTRPVEENINLITTFIKNNETERQLLS